MKKILIISIIASLAICVNVQTTFSQGTPMWPWGASDYQAPAKDSGAVAIVLKNNMTFIDFNSGGALDTVLGNITMSITYSAGVKRGAMCFIRFKNGAAGGALTVNAATLSTANYCIPLSTAIPATIGKRQLIELWFDGTYWQFIAVKKID